jgi:hypothetical protein
VSDSGETVLLGQVCVLVVLFVYVAIGINVKGNVFGSSLLTILMVNSIVTNY